MNKNYQEYITEDLIENVLNKINKLKAVPESNDTYNEELWDFFQDQLIHFSFYVAIFIFKENDVFDLTVNVCKRHLPPDEFNQFIAYFNSLDKTVSDLRKKNEAMYNSEPVQLINYIFCSIYCEVANEKMENISELIHWFEQTKENVVNLITFEIGKKVKEKNH